jgi:hypothetical protein
MILLLVAFPYAIPVWALLPAILVYFVILSVLGLRRMASIALPGSYIRTHAATSLLQLAGLVTYFYLALL